MADIAVLAPHMDDETLGCGGVIALADDPIVIFGCWSRDEGIEVDDVSKILGYRYEVLYDKSYEARFLSIDRRELVGRIEEVLHREQPDRVFVPSPSYHQDHSVLFDAGVAATRPLFARGLHRLGGRQLRVPRLDVAQGRARGRAQLLRRRRIRDGPQARGSAVLRVASTDDRSSSPMWSRPGPACVEHSSAAATRRHSTSFATSRHPEVGWSWAGSRRMCRTSGRVGPPATPPDFEVADCGSRRRTSYASLRC